MSVIQLLEEKRLRKSDFIVTENYHIRLKEQTAKALIEKIKLNMNAKVVFKNRNATYQTILFENVRAVANFVIGKSKWLDFHAPMHTIKRNDDLNMQRRILAMTPEERKRLGISKSGLWYQKKRIVDGKTGRIYRKILSKLS